MLQLQTGRRDDGVACAWLQTKSARQEVTFSIPAAFRTAPQAKTTSRVPEKLARYKRSATR